MRIKDAKLKFIIESAKTLFLKKGIAAVTIKDIAQEVGLGEATIYRYFSKKQNIVVAIALSILEGVSDEYFHSSRYKTGFEKIRAFYYSFDEIFKDHPEYFRFIAEFDEYIVGQPSNLNNYEQAIKGYYDEFEESYKLGLKDESIKEVGNLELFYLSTTHALLELCKKLATEIKVLKQDKKYKNEEIEMLIEIFLNTIRK